MFWNVLNFKRLWKIYAIFRFFNFIYIRLNESDLKLILNFCEMFDRFWEAKHKSNLRIKPNDNSNISNGRISPERRVKLRLEKKIIIPKS